MHRVVTYTVSGARRKYFCATEDGEWLYKKLRANPQKLTRIELWYNEELLKACNVKRNLQRRKLNG
jgi:hypothetical protein